GRRCVDVTKHAVALVAGRHHAAAAGPLATHLELRLDEADEGTVVRNERPDRRQGHGQGEEAEVADDDVEPPPERGGIELPDVGALEVDDPGILGDRRGELSVPDIEGRHLPRSVLEEDLCETPGARPDVEASPAR